MGRRSRSDVVWQPVKARGRPPYLLLLTLAALVAIVGYMNSRTLDGPSVIAAPAPDAPIAEASAGQPTRRKARITDLSTVPRESPLPRQEVAPRRAPPPRGEVREAAVDRGL